MSVEPLQFRLYIVRAPLKAVASGKLWSPAAEELLMMTAATESHLGYWIRQVGGIALGDFQMEPATFHDCNRYLKLRPLDGFTPHDDPEILMYDRAAATIYARVKYLMDPDPIPPANDLPGLAAYYKRIYNSHIGKGSVEKALADYAKYVVG